MLLTVPQPRQDLEQVILELVNRVSHDLYDDNLQINYGNAFRQEGPRRIRFTVRVVDSKGPGHRVSSGNMGQPQRRLVAACWHVYRDVLAEIFRRWPEATVRTALAVYRGREGFLDKFPDTFYVNSGSQMYPVSYGYLCRCDYSIRDREVTF